MPSCRSQPSWRLELQRRNAIGVTGDGVDRLKPGQQIDMAAMEDCASRDGCLATTGGAFVDEPLCRQFPRFCAAATGADKPLGQRRSKRRRAQVPSSGNRLMKAVRDIGRSVFQRLGIRTNIEHSLGLSSWDAHYLWGYRSQRDKPLNFRKEYDPEKHAVMTLDEFELWLTLQIVGRYHQDYHRGIMSLLLLLGTGAGKTANACSYSRSRRQFHL